jgi:solute:Na+ symporter, SSS family
MPEISFGWINWTVFLVYIFFIFVLGAMFTGRQKNTDEFFRAGKRMGWFPILISLVASVFSAISFLGQPARIYKSDATVLICLFIASFFFLPIFAYAILPFYRKLDITTAYEYLEKRFSIQVRCIGSALFILQRLFWMALVCLAPSLVLSLVLGVKVEYCILIIGLIATVYTALGGMSAVIWTDVAQFFVLISGQILFFVMIVTKLDGGLTEIFQLAVSDNKFFGSMNWDISRPTFWTLLISSILMGLGFGVDQVNIQRIMATRDGKQARKSVLYQLILNIPRYMILILMGISMYAFYQVFPEKLAPGMDETPDKILPYFIMTQIPAGLCGLVIAAIFAAAMSSFDSGLNCLTAVFVIDWYKNVIKPGQDDAKYLFVAKLLTVILGLAITVLGIIIYKSGIKSIVDSSNKYLGFFFGPIVGIFLLGIFTRRAKAFPVVIASIISFILVLAIDVVNIKLGAGNQIINMYFYGPIAIIVTVVIGYLGSLFGPELPFDNIREFTLAKKKS